MTVADRVDREHRTLEAMMDLHCRARHGTGGVPCPDCAELLAYAKARAARCRFLPAKPTCASCPVHCYRPDMRERIREVMRTAGPRMAFRHPWLSLLHALDARTVPPPRLPGKGRPGATGR